jgi:SpoVK/Ycf46/Vps4 family AAA+-type ATPase
VEAAVSAPVPNIITLASAPTAGNTLVGKMLANQLDVPFVELKRLVDVQARYLALCRLARRLLHGHD